MDTQMLCACDQTCQRPICTQIEHVDTVKNHLAVLAKNIAKVRTIGLWLNPFRGIPRSPRFARFDVIYLDEDCRVLEFAENFTEAEFAAFQGDTATALILPPHTLKLSSIKKGNQLRICKGTTRLAPLENLAFSTTNGKGLCPRDIGQQTPIVKPTLREQPIDELSDLKPSPKLRLLRWLFRVPSSSDRRKAERLIAPDLVAYYWNGGAPVAHKLGNVSQSGLYLLTEERWFPGTRLVMTLQKRLGRESSAEEIARVEATVVRWGEDGIGCEFVQAGFVDLNNGELIDGKFDQQAFRQFL